MVKPLRKRDFDKFLGKGAKRVILKYSSIIVNTIPSGSIAGDSSYVAVDSDNQLVLTSTVATLARRGLGTTTTTYQPTITLPLSAYDSITDCSVGGTGAGNAITAVVDGQGSGEMIKLGTFHVGVTTKGHIVMLYNAMWYPADRSDSSYSSAADAMLAVALDVNNGDDEGLVLLRGVVRIASTLMNGFTDAATDIGRPVYLSTTAGEYDMAVSSTNNDIVRIVGHMLDTDGTDHLIYFNPSNDWVKVSS